MSDSAPTFMQLLRRPVNWLAFGFGAGLAPKAPGTFGTLVAVPIYWLIQDWPPALYLGWLALTFAVGVYLCDRCAKDMGVHDHPGIVWDEMLGYWLTMAFAPAGWAWMLYGFVLFRIFDIAKPWPISWIDRRVHGGMGIMLDDVLAAVFALIVLQVTAYGIL